MQDIIIKNEDFGLENKDFSENHDTRYASRGIVVNPETKEIAVVVKVNINEYKLPGGGKEGDETEEETFYREVFEETGCKVNIIKKLGVIKEERSGIDQIQYSNIFVSELIEDTGELHPTEKEIEEGLTIKWMNVDDALNAIKNSFNTVTGDERGIYVEHFIIQRDVKILEAYKNSL
jgi:8-oxo-dGTP diphosphatase